MGHKSDVSLKVKPTLLIFSGSERFLIPYDELHSERHEAARESEYRVSPTALLQIGTEGEFIYGRANLYSSRRKPRAVRTGTAVPGLDRQFRFNVRAVVLTRK